MTSIAVRKALPPTRKNAPCYFDPMLLSEAKADELWRRCAGQIDRFIGVKAPPGGVVRVEANQTAQLYFLVNNRGQLERFWLRLMQDNRLLIVGNRSGLLPLDVEPIHG